MVMSPPPPMGVEVFSGCTLQLKSSVDGESTKKLESCSSASLGDAGDYKLLGTMPAYAVK